jgi:glycosyltransferase involved in cell wall biosynthesis
VFFGSYPFSYVRDGRRPAILALHADNFIGEVRIKPYLNALLARGVIADYQVVDRSMAMAGPLKSYQFTHIWCQRSVSTAQFAFLKRHARVPIVYDIDDLITSIPDFVMKVKRRNQARMTWCLRHAKAITVATERLGAGLREDVPSLAGEIVVVPNGCTNATPPVRREPRKQIIWTSSDVPFFLDGYPDFLEDLAALASRAGYEVVLIGRFDAKVAAKFDRCRQIAYLDFASYRAFLQSCAGAIGLAPLPSNLPAPAQRYFDAKSDIKLVDYLSSGIVPVCSSAAPYAESSLFLPALAGADANELLRRLEMCIADHARMVEYVNGTIHAPGLLRQREFSELSTALDHLVK